MKRRQGATARRAAPDPSSGGGRQVGATPAKPAPQAGLSKWIEYAETAGIDVPDDIREDKAAVRALIDEK